MVLLSMTQLVKLSLVAALLALIPTSYSCSDHLLEGRDHGHTHYKRLAPLVQLTPPWGPLQWGDVNIIHTTDTHGWLLGHGIENKSFPEPNYSGDFGDFASFVTHMKQIALERDVDLLLVDSGDLHDGTRRTGLSDGYPPGGVDGHDSNQFFKQLPYDVLSIGNHELYDYAVTLDMHLDFAPHFNGRYLTSNVNITIADDKGNNVHVPVGSRYAKFKTRKGRTVTALGILFNFTHNTDNTTVQPVESMVKEDWFLQAIADEPSFFLLVGHMPVSNDSWPVVFNAVRAVHSNTPILILGGHSHIRDCNQLDGRSMSLQSGRYMETLGWMSVNLSETSPNANLNFSRRYLDPNRVTYEYHTQTSYQPFDTPLGQKIMIGLLGLWESFNLGYEFGTAPQDYYLNWAPYPSNSSLYTELTTKVLPYALTVNNPRVNISNIMIINSGSQRFDLYAGSFNKNAQLAIAQYPDKFQFIADVPLSVASQVLPKLNSRRPSVAQRSLEESYGRGDVDHIYHAWLERMAQANVWEGRDVHTTKQDFKTLGYVTSDKCPGVGDDTLHTRLNPYKPPSYISSPVPPLPDNATVDLVFLDYVNKTNNIPDLLNKLQTQKNYTEADVHLYTEVRANEVWGIYAQSAWN